MSRLQDAVGAVIRRERHARAWKLRDLAERAALSVVYLGEIERGRKYPSAAVVERIAAAFAVPVPELIESVADELRGESPVEMRGTLGFTTSRHPDAGAVDVNALLQRLDPDEQQTIADLGAFFLARKGPP